MTNLQHKIRYDYLDWFRVFACIAVVTIHVTAAAIALYLPKSLPQVTITMINGFTLFAVPAFILISGYTFMVVYEKKDIDFATFFKRRVSIIVLPYLLWNIFYTLYAMRLSHLPFSWSTLGYNLLTGKAFYHLYFMPLIFQFYILFIPLKKLVDRVHWAILFPLTLIFHYFYTTQIKASIPLSDRVFLSYMIFYMIGMLLGRYHLKVVQSIKVWIFPVLVLYGVSEYFYVSDRVNYFVYQANSPFQLPYSWELSSVASVLVILALCVQLQKWSFGTQIARRFSSVSFDVYLAHPLVLSLLSIYFGRLGIHSTTLQVVVSWSLGILVPFAIAILIKNIKSSKKTLKAS